MKIKSLLVMAISLMVGTSAFADWTKPANPAKGSDPVSDKQYYIMNVEAGQYLKASKVWFSWATSAGLADDGQLSLLTDNAGAWTIQNVADGRYTFISGPADGRGEMHVDGANATQWVFKKNANGTYTIAIDPADAVYGDAYAGTCWGWVGSAGSPNNAVVANLTAETGHVEWLFLTQEAYDEFKAVQADYVKSVNTYYTALSLGAKLTEAKAAYPTVDFAAEQAVYDGGTATLEEVEAAIASVAAKIKAYDAAEAEKNASYANPTDMTKMITNPTFDGTTFEGWSGSGFGAGGTTSSCAERYQMVFDTWQLLEDMPNGVYKVNVDGFYRAGGAADDFIAEANGKNFNSLIYGINVAEAADTLQSAIMHLSKGIEPGQHLDKEGNPIGGMEVKYEGETYYVPNSMLDFTNFNGTTKELDNPYYKTNSVLVPVSEGKLQIGVKNATTLGWTIVDNFGLTYYGNGADAWGALVSDFAKNAGIGEDVVATKALVEEYNKTLAALSATDYATYKAAVSGVADQKKAIDENIAAWAAYKAEGEKANKLILDPKYASIAVDLADYLKNDFEFEMEDLILTTEEVIAETKKLSDLYEDAKALTPEGTDVSSMLTNPDFSKGWDGWSHSGTGGNVAANSGAKCAEAWNSANFDIHQDIENAPVGAYEIQVQGFYRYMRGDNAWLAYFNEDGTKRTDPNEFIKETPARIYCNANTTAMANVFDYGVAVEDNYYTGDFYTDPNGGFTYPNNMADAGLAFDRGAYSVSTFGLVSKKGDPLRVGIKGNSNQEGDSWAIFTRFKLIYQGYNADVIKPELEKNLNAELGDQKMSATTKEAYNKAVEAGKTALTSGDGKAMFDALSAIFDQKEAAENSAKVYAELSVKLDELAEVFESGNSAYRDEATMLWIEASGKVENGEFTDEEAAETVEKVANVIKKLAIPEEANEATEENPCDMTDLITNPSFETGNTTGWTNDGTQAMGAQSNTAFGKTGNYYCEKWHAAGTLDLNQTLTVLPAGKYVLSADIHCSTGDGVLYANNEQTPVTNTEDASAPNTDQVTVVIAENEPLKFGIKATLTGSTWCCVDNFQLSYLGNAGDGIANISNQTVSKTAIYSINGTQISKFQKGINIIRVNGKAAKYIVK